MKKDEALEMKKDEALDVEAIDPQKELPAVKFSDSTLPVVDRVNKSFVEWLSPEILLIEYPVLVTCDWHVPHTSTEWVKKLLVVQKSRKVPNLVINGDFLDEAGSSKFVEMGPNIPLEEELSVGSILLNGLLNYFERIYIVLGNHDMNLLKDFGKKAEAFFSKRYAKILFGEMVDPNLFDTRVFVSCLKWCETVDRKWLICHPDAYSKIGSSIPVKVGQLKGKNVIGGHGHHLAMAKTENGLFWGIDGGGMFNDESMIYKIAHITLHPEFNNGFVLLNEKGEAKLYGDGLE
jgi:predicted phosphodiesterase